MSISQSAFSPNCTGALLSMPSAPTYPSDHDRSRQQVKLYLQKCGVPDERASVDCDRIVKQAAAQIESQSGSGKTAELSRVAMLLTIEELTLVPSPSQGAREVIPASIDRPMWNASPVRRAASLRMGWWVEQFLGGSRISILKGRRRYAGQQN